MIDGIIPEPLGGSHRDYELAAKNIKQQLVRQLTELQSRPISMLVDERYKRIMAYGMNA